MELAKSRVTIDKLNFDGDDSDITNLQIWQPTGKPEGTMGKAIVKGYSYFKSTPLRKQLMQPDKMLLAHYFRFALRVSALSINELRKYSSKVIELMIISYHVGMIGLPQRERADVFN